MAERTSIEESDKKAAQGGPDCQRTAVFSLRELRFSAYREEREAKYAKNKDLSKSLWEPAKNFV
jgi:hypothetical protein